MPEVIVRKGEPIDRALKRLKTKLDTEGILDEVRRLRAFETPTQRTKRKAKAKVRFVLS
jgi:small subunit ribosomal protein S21